MKLGLTTLSPLALAVGLSFAAATTVQADQNSQNQRQLDNYFGIGLHTVTYDEDDGLWANWDIKGESEGAFAVYFGKKRNSFLSTELAYHHLGTYEAGSNAEVSAGNFSYSLRLSVPVGPVEPYVLGGVGAGFVRWDVGTLNDSGSGFSTRLGAGVRFQASQGFSLAAYAEQFSYDIELSSGGSNYNQEFSLLGLAAEFHY